MRNSSQQTILQNHLGLLLGLYLPVTIACIDVMAVSVALNEIMRDFAASINKTQQLFVALFRIFVCMPGYLYLVFIYKLLMECPL